MEVIWILMLLYVYFSLMAFGGHTEGIILSSRRNRIFNFLQKCEWKISAVQTFFFFFLAVLGLRCCTWALSGCSSRASHCSGFSCCGAPALGAWASVVVAHGL